MRCARGKCEKNDRADKAETADDCSSQHRTVALSALSFFNHKTMGTLLVRSSVPIPDFPALLPPLTG